jgi:hypothetical protein
MPVSVKDLIDLRTSPQETNSAFKWMVLGVAGAILLALAVRMQIDHYQPARSLVERLVSPDGSMDAALYELNGKASDSFDYEVVIESQGQSRLVARVAGARRNDRSYGVDLRWSDHDALAVNYLSAENQQLLASGLTIDGRQVHVTLNSGVRDQEAPPGGMLFNLRESHEPPV